MKYVLLILTLLVAHPDISGQSLRIEDCYNLAEQNYPLLKQRGLIARTKTLLNHNSSAGFLPQIAIYGQATYQSAVTELPLRIPGQEVNALSKDQYRLYTEISQAVYDGGFIKHQKQLQDANAAVETQKLEVELHKLKEQVNHLFFGWLVVDEQMKQTELLKNDIRLGMRKTEAAIANGTALNSNLDALKAELLKADQHTIELAAARKAYIDMLSLLISQTLDEKTILMKPVIPTVVDDVNRPEVPLFNYQLQSLVIQDRLSFRRNMPRVSLFVQGGFGRPALNMLSNDLETYYVGGLRVSWTLSGLYNRKRDTQILTLSRETIDAQLEAFLLNNKLTSSQQSAEVSKYEKLLEADATIVSLRKKVKQTALIQLENGTITANDYLREVNAEDEARQAHILHEIQRIMSLYALETTRGNIN